MSPAISTPPRRPRGERGAFRRYLALLEGLAGAPPDISTFELARRSGLAQSTAYRLLHELIELGVLVRDRLSGRYVLSFRMWQLFERFDWRQTLVAAAMPVMQQLRDDLGETVLLTTYVGHEQHCVAQIPGRAATHVTLSFPRTQRLDAGAAGKLILAFLPELSREAFLERLAETDGPERAQALRHIADALRSSGYVAGPVDDLPEFTSLAVPVMGPAAAIAVLELVGPSSRWTPDAAVVALPRLRTAADDIAQALGLSRTAT
ncbi:MAG: transcriptional regulator [Dehalococcoidia bacterium]|jgi:DNA-binding IclR family transcriptional regulator|nr:MAG: transcriptional regulator [Dehalococcoidia bacterium]